MERSQELADFYVQSIRSASQGASVAPIFSTSPDTLVIGTDPGEQWQGADAVPAVDGTAKNFREQGAQFSAGDPVAWEHNGVGWVVDRPVVRFPDGQKLTFRLSSVYVREGDGWKAVHQHWSIGVPNEQADQFVEPA